MQQPECKKGSTVVSQPYRKRLDIAMFWRISKEIRLNQTPPEVVDMQITTLLARPADKVSDWAKEKLEELRKLNKKRFRS